MKLRPTGLSCLLGHIERWQKHSSKTLRPPSMGSHLNSGGAFCGGSFLSLDCSLVSQPVSAQSGQCSRENEKKPRHERYGTESSTVKDDLDFARRGKESTYISVSIWNTLLFPPTSDLIYRMKWQTDVCIPNTRSPTILKTSFSSWIMKTFVYFAVQHMADYLKILILY